jgi:uncharacterized membrane protein YqjE
MAAENGNEYAQEQLNNINAFQGTVTNAAVLGALGGIIKNLSHSLSRNVIDSTTHKYRQDRKLMQKEMRLKAIQGQKRGLEQYM